MRTLSLGTKLVIGFFAVVLTGFCGNLLSMISLGTLADQTDAIVDVALERYQAARDMKTTIYNTLISIERLKNPRLSSEEYDRQFVLIEEGRKERALSYAAYDRTIDAATLERLGVHEDDSAVALYKEMQVQRAALTADNNQILDYARQHQGEAGAALGIAHLYIEIEAGAARDMALAATEALIIDSETTLNELVAGANDSGVFVRASTAAAALISLLLGVLIAAAFVRSINKAVEKISKTLLTSAGYITASSKELSAGSQALASGSSEQAAAIEEISASLEEISSMVKQNADNAVQASKLTASASHAIDATNTSMQRSLAASEEIAKASNETNKIIKTIDEIAFQTNLLSLNAAVEAARAGEAGTGFAVVAGEVRGLSMRSAEASKRTAELIEQTIAKVREGIEIFNLTGKSIGEVVTQTHTIRQLVEGIASASEEQAKGIDQINRGVAEMEKVIQQNAANSEESAASTEELHAQAAEMASSASAFEAYVFGARHAKRISGSALLAGERE